MRARQVRRQGAWTASGPLANDRKASAVCLCADQCPLSSAAATSMAGTAAGVAVGWQVERVGELPFLRFVAPLNGRRTGNVVGLTVRANRRGPASSWAWKPRTSWGPVFGVASGVSSNGLSSVVCLKSPPGHSPASLSNHNFGPFGCLHTLVCWLWILFRFNDRRGCHATIDTHGGPGRPWHRSSRRSGARRQVPAAGTVLPAKCCCMAGERWLVIPASVS